MKNIFTFCFVFFAIHIFAQTTNTSAFQISSTVSVFDIEAAKNFDELEKIVNDKNFERLKKEALDFDKENAFEVLKLQYFSEAIQSPAIRLHIVYEILELRKLHEGSTITPPDNSLLNKFTEKAKGGATVAELTKGFTEAQLIEAGKSLGFTWTTAGSKKDKVVMLLEKLGIEAI